MESRTYECWFERFHSLDEDCIQVAKDFAMVFRLDTLSRDAFMEGHAGISPVLAFEGPRGITFLELLPTGAVQTTTIGADGSAVHSRNSLIVGEVVPSQYYGECQIQ